MLVFTLISLTVSTDSAGVGGFVSFQFPYNGDKASLFSQLTVVIKTPQGSLIDTAEVQPTGYWVIPTPQHRELVITIRKPSGLVISPPTSYIQYPFNSNVDFQIQGFSVSGTIVAKADSNSLVHVSLLVEVTNGKDITISNMSSTDGTYTIGPLPPGEYKVSLKDAIAESQKVTVDKPLSECNPLIITEWAQSGSVEFPEGTTKHSVKLQLSGEGISQEVETDKDGRFVLKGLSVGSYQLKSANEDIIISSASFSISVSKLPVPIVMRYEGLKVHGKVTFPDAKGLSNVAVTLNPGNHHTKTDENGNFVFTQILSIEAPKLEVSYPFYKFEIPEIPPITIEPLPLINVLVTEAPINCRVECPKADLTFTGAVNTKVTVTNGTFCITSPVGEDVTIKAESECGFEYNEITVKSPNEKVRFSRMKATVDGTVKCINDKCNTNTILKLINSNYKYETKLNENGQFTFEDIEFGNYKLSILNTKNEKFAISKKDVKVSEKFTKVGEIGAQTSFVYNVTVSHSMSVKCGDEILQLQRGLNTIETKSTIIESYDCHKFSNVNIQMNQRIIVESIERQVIVNGEEGTYTVYLNNEELNSPYKFNQKVDEEVTISLKAIAPYVVNPESQKVKSVSTCEECGIKFDVIRGIEYSGKIIPAVSGVSMTAISDGKVISSTLTNDLGEYSLGSYPSNINIEVTAVLDGYKFTKKEKSFDFESEKLSSIYVTFEHQPNANVKGIMLSISRVDGYAHNVMIDDENSVINNLEKGQYYIKPILREHEFIPSQTTIELTQQEANISFSIIRVKFGISGEVRRVTGEPEPDIEIEAVYPNGEHQTTVTDSHGKFRIGGLLPNQTITLISKISSTSLIGKVTPTQLKVKMENEEKTNIRFISLKPNPSFDIIGELDILPDFLPSMNVALMSSNGKVVDRFTFPSKLSNMFYFTNLTDEKYFIYAASTMQAARINCTAPEIEKQTPQVNTVVECQVAQDEAIEETHGSVVAATALAIVTGIVWVCIFNLKKVKELILDAKQMVLPSKKTKKGNKKQK
ncbi:nodal modulator 1-like [Histomonas meleagridis]|uniref:nodal modulator 1-like n=1 Tax=Histomonas meleagridis TaxID=135588 RepID=UPI003559C5E0|nr:nodal modulator 1-like [Histomonas meleagridis]KAH0803708.1 nodal modulator 1-like [Histomonas meleagridis]